MSTAMMIASRGLILKTMVGSRVTGVSTGGDIDQMGICLEPPQYVTGLRTFDQYVYRDAKEGERSKPGELDLTVYSARKWMRLAVQGNPTILTPLFVPKAEVLNMTIRGKQLRDNAHKIVSKQAGPRFIGYMKSQMGPLRGEKGHTNRPELIEQFGYDTKFAAHAIRLGLQGIELAETGKFTLPITQPDLGQLREIREGKSSAKDVLAWAEDLVIDLEIAFAKSWLPNDPDMTWVNEFLHEAQTEYWNGNL